MSPKFELSGHRTNNILHLQLAGEFDGSSACELVQKIIQEGSGTSQVLVDTSEVRAIHPFGKTVLQNHLGQVTRKAIDLTFTGKHKKQFEQ
jgi:anti-anti-sigma regulatory factor